MLTIVGEKPDRLDAGIISARLDRLPATPEQRQAVEVTRTLIWWLYADLKAWKRDPCPRRATALRARFDRSFRR